MREIIGAMPASKGYDAERMRVLLTRIEEQYAALEEAAREVVGAPFGSIDQRAFYRLREVLGD